MIKKLEDAKRSEPLFLGWEEPIIWACLEKIMGDIYVLDDRNPLSAIATLGDFYFFAGYPDEKLIRNFQQEGWLEDFAILVPQNRQWEELIEGRLQGRVKKCFRYSTKKEPNIFNVEYLKSAVGHLEQGYELKKIDSALYNQCLESEWSKDLVNQYSSYEKYERLGMGFAVIHNGDVVCGASSYATFKKGIEVQIDTKKEYRRKGLAYACGAKLLLECLDKGWYPSWDAQNRNSLALAEKLGYQYNDTYTVLEYRKE